MKTKKGLCIFLSILMIAVSFVACGKKNPGSSDELITKVDENGVTYVEVTNENGEAVTNADGEVVTSVISDGAGNTTQANANTASKTQGTTGANGLPDFDDDMDVTAAKEDLLPTGKEVTTKKSASTLRDDVIVKIIKSGKFTMKTNIISGGNKIPATIAFNNKDFCMDTTYSQFNMRVLAKDGKMYLVLPALKMYYESSDGDATGLGAIDFSTLGDDDQKYIKTTEVDNLTCEEYSTDGGTVKYYFDSSKNWKRWECIMEDGTLTAFEITSFSNKVDSSLFSLDGLNKLDQKALEALGNQ